MLKIVDVNAGIDLGRYSSYSSLAMGVRELMTEAASLVPKISPRKVWMVNSTASGGGVAEMMPGTISILRQLGISCEWVVASAEQKEYFILTKKLHNLIHGEPQDALTGQERALYEEVNRLNAEALSELVNDNDVVVIHDPQPMAIPKFMNGKKKLHFVWRCHIGLDKQTKETDAAWQFLKPYSEPYHIALFSAPEYIPSYFSGRGSVIYPAIDPLDHKNRELPIYKLVGILCNANLITEYHPVLTPPFIDTVKRLQPDGSFQSPLLPSEPGLLFRPCVLQVSRWDRLKGFLPLLKGFEILKKNIAAYAESNTRQARHLELTHLVLAGPDPDFVDDDPEGRQVLGELCEYYKKLPPAIQHNISILKLPMSSRKYNELIVNALQRAATVVVQNSIQEGFGLTVTEAMWKAIPVIGSSACGIRQQVRDNIDGKLVTDPNDPSEIASMISYTLLHNAEREVWSMTAQKRAADNFLVFTHIRMWLRVLAGLTEHSH